MTIKRIGRRDVLKWAGIGAALAGVPGWGSRASANQGDVVEISGWSNYRLGQWYFDPVGLYIEKGQTVRWIGTNWGITVTAFHPDNGNHELRIPERARPFDSGVLAEGGYRDKFEWTFDVEGTYDYFSLHHEILGMVGRIVVGKPGGPAEQPPGYGGRDGRVVVFPAQVRVLEAVPSNLIMDQQVIPYPTDLVKREYPFAE